MCSSDLTGRIVDISSADFNNIALPAVRGDGYIIQRLYAIRNIGFGNKRPALAEYDAVGIPHIDRICVFIARTGGKNKKKNRQRHKNACRAENFRFHDSTVL